MTPPPAATAGDTPVRVPPEGEDAVDGDDGASLLALLALPPERLWRALARSPRLQLRIGRR